MTRSHLSRTLAALCGAAVLPDPALAAAATGEETPLDLGSSPAAHHVASTGGGGLVRTIVGLAVVLAVIYGLHWVLKQVKQSRGERHVGAGLGSLATLPLGPNRALHLVRAGAEVVLVGVGEGGVTPIRVYSGAEVQELGLLDAAPELEAPRLPALLDAGPSSLPASLRAPKLRQLVEDLRARTVLR